jgi:hypothetical protein
MQTSGEWFWRETLLKLPPDSIKMKVSAFLKCLKLCQVIFPTSISPKYMAFKPLLNQRTKSNPC